jgi:hypothetical protein
MSANPKALPPGFPSGPEFLPLPPGPRMASRLRLALLLLAPVAGSLLLALLFGSLLVPDHGPTGPEATTRHDVAR